MATIDSVGGTWNDGDVCRKQRLPCNVEIQRQDLIEMENGNIINPIRLYCKRSDTDTNSILIEKSALDTAKIAESSILSSAELPAIESISVPQVSQEKTNLKLQDKLVEDLSKIEFHSDLNDENDIRKLTNLSNDKGIEDISINSNSNSSICDIIKIKNNSSSNNINPTSGSIDNTTKSKTVFPSSSYCKRQNIPPHIRILPKTQSLDLADEQIEDDANDNILTSSKSSDLPTTSSSSTSVAGGTSLCNKGGMPKIHSLDHHQTRPIYPNVPYSPYGSPYGSPRSGRRRGPLRESRRISIEQSGSFVQLNQYKLLDEIGQGSYGLVKLAYSEEDSIHYAMKILSKRKLLRKAGLIFRGPKRGMSPLDRVYREIAVLKKLDHPNVVKLVEVLDDPKEDSLYLVFELVELGEIMTIPSDNPIPEARAWSIFRDVLQGLEYLHYQHIIHGDIKPDNLLLGECGRVKIADLGVCNEFFGDDAAMNNGSGGTPAYRAPETLLTGQQSYCGKAADIWALGITLYAIIFGNVPYVAPNIPAVYEKIKNDELTLPWNKISAELRDLIEKMLNKDPTKRITLPQVKVHNWVTSMGACTLPSEEENCRLVQVSEEEINSAVKSTSKLDTLILIKSMLKKHSFQNPYSKGISGRAPQRGGSRLERFTKAGRSNSAPGAYHLVERQLSSENILPSVTEGEVVTSCPEQPIKDN